MRELEKYIRERGIVLSDSVVKVNSFLNHLVDPLLIMDLGRNMATRFQADSVTKVLTIEASGIHIAYAAAYCLGVPFVYAKKSKAVTQSDVYEVKSKRWCKFVPRKKLVLWSFGGRLTWSLCGRVSGRNRSGMGKPGGTRA